ncbi:MAG TPA: outer membrane protein assembly factor BamD [Acidobacteriaceae bacterium]|nr:outer membrane protein assembly factor BamD [Acidobacteriaceae bacterium]
MAGVVAAGLMLTGISVHAQVVTGSSQTTTDAQGQKQESTTISVDTSRKKHHHVDKADRVQQTKDTRRELKKEKKYNPLIGKDMDLPDKQLYDKAMAQIKSGHFDVARLDLNTLLSTYPDSQYQMRAKLAVADSWYREGGSAALAQAEQEYKDFITFFPNSPEAAEAQMRVGDIYFKQMDVPDRDYSKAEHAEQEYRTMLQQYPDAPKEILTQATQKLRDVQEVLAQREADIAQFYGTHDNWPAAIARYETVKETYPQYSHMDDVLIGIGDAYAAEAKAVRAQASCSKDLPKGQTCLPEGAKSQLEQEYDGKAAEEYREVVLKHAAAPHVEDAKERLAAMNLPIPQPTAEEVAASEALEGSRAQYTMRKRLELIFLRKPDTVTAAGMGNPPLADPQPVVAPTVVNDLMADYRSALNPNAPKADAIKAATPAVETPAEVPPQPLTPPGTPASTAPPMLSDVPSAGNGTGDGSTSVMTEETPSTPGATTGGSNASMGVEVLTPGATSGTAASSLPASTGTPDANYGMKAVGPKDTSALPPVQAPEAAPDQVNEAAGQPQPPAETKKPGQKKNPKPAYDKNDESSSKHKKKKGVDKLNPF